MHAHDRPRFTDFPRPLRLLAAAILFTSILLTAASWLVWQSHQEVEQRFRQEFQTKKHAESVGHSRATQYLRKASQDTIWLQVYDTASSRLDSLFLEAIQSDLQTSDVDPVYLTDTHDIRKARVLVETTLLDGFVKSEIPGDPDHKTTSVDSPFSIRLPESISVHTSTNDEFSSQQAGLIGQIFSGLNGIVEIDVTSVLGYEDQVLEEALIVPAASILQAMRKRTTLFILLIVSIILVLVGLFIVVVKQFSYYFTERQHAMRTLLDSETRNIALLQAVPDTMLLMDRTGTLLDYHAIEDMPGLSAMQFVGNSVKDGLPAAIADRTIKAIEETLDTGETQSFEYTLSVNDKVKHFEARIVSCGGDKALAIMRDVTEQEHAERTVRETENKFRILVEQSQTGIYIIQDGRFVYVNPRFTEITGYSIREVSGFEDITNIVISDDRMMVRDNMDRLLSGDSQHLNFSTQFIRKDGRIIIAEVYGSATEYKGRPAVIGALLDITEQREAEEGLRILGMAVEQSAEGVLVMDTNGIISFVNPAWARMHGFEVSEVTGKHFRIFHTADQMRKEIFPVINRFETIRLYRAEMGHKRKDGSTFPSSTAFATLKNDNDRVFGAVAICRDITEQKQYESELLEAKKKAEDMSRMKSAILTNVSHEIRTPLTGIIGCATVLEEEITEPQREFAQLIRVSGNRLMLTLNSVLDLARLEAGEMALVPREVNLTSEIEEVTSLFILMARQKGIQLTTHFSAQEIQAKLDPDVVNIILNNLIGNAIKFTETGEIRVTVTADENEFSISVSDTGIGIGSQFLPFLFDEFKQESIGLTRSYEGSGIGLSITKRLVELMHGRIEVTSEKGIGSTFTVSFPRYVPIPTPQEVASG